MIPPPKDQQQKQGALAAAVAFSIWGLVVIYWKHLEDFSSLELIIYRLIAGLIFALLAIALRGSLKEFLVAFKSPKLIKIHFVNGVLLAINWLCYIYAITHGHILEGSLAYFMVPILNTAMGFVFLKERLTILQWAAIGLATLGVANEVIQFGRVPWLAVIIALSFAIYGMNKTKSPLGPLTSLSMEITLLVPLALIGLIVLGSQGNLHMNPGSTSDWIWLLSSGIITITPLILFAYGAKRIQLTTIGVFQFFAPSIKFFIGVFMYGEAFSTSKLITFAFIWAALAVYLTHLFRNKSKKT